MLERYCGSRTREHFGDGAGSSVLTTYGTDRSGTKQYRFNSLGFRGEEHDPDAAATIFACGCSITFGTGLDAEESWPHRFKLAYAQRLGRGPRDVNLLNFSQGGASNDYIARTLLTQCARVRPDLVLAQFSAMHRAEGYVDGEPYCIGLGLWPSFSVWTRFLGVPWKSKWTVLRRMRQAAGHARAYSEEAGFANALRAMLLVQFYCRANGIPCVMTWTHHRRLAEPEFRDHPALAPLIALLDPSVFCDFAIRDPDICTDAAADGGHPGPRSNAAFAERVLAFHERAMQASS